MLYPLSYEGLRCTFAQYGGQVLVRARAGCLAPDGLCRTCAACREPADPPPSRHATPIVRRGGAEPMTGGGSMGCELVALLLGKIAYGGKLSPDQGASALRRTCAEAVSAAGGPLGRGMPRTMQVSGRTARRPTRRDGWSLETVPANRRGRPQCRDPTSRCGAL
jgi:hypothetical protein